MKTGRREKSLDYKAFNYLPSLDELEDPDQIYQYICQTRKQSIKSE
jgi:hypothetical protein